MSLTFVTPRAFKEIPQDIRAWSGWIRDAFQAGLVGVVGTTDLDNASVTYAKIQNIATDTLIGRATAGSGAPEAIACTAAGRALIDDAAASNQRTTLGLGTSATVDTGTSGATVPLLNAANTWTLAQTLSAPPILPSYTVAGVPSASPAGQLAYISNEAGGAVLAFSTGADWRRVTDRAIIS
jgi:hypothetical protein